MSPFPPWYPPTRPRPVDGGLQARSRRGRIGQHWWSEHFLEGLEASTVGGRLARGKRYARAGQVIELHVETGAAVALVQGSRAVPYRVRVGLEAFGKADWARVGQALAEDAWYAAKLLAGEMPTDIADVFAAAGLTLFPTGVRDLTMDCTCPDVAVPCKHLAATLYLLAESLDDDPFAVLALRGRPREELLADLGARRAGLPALDPVARSQGAAPLADLLENFWTAPRPATPQPPVAVAADSLLQQVPRGQVVVRGRDLVDLLRPAYRSLGGAAGTSAPGRPEGTHGK